MAFHKTLFKQLSVKNTEMDTVAWDKLKMEEYAASMKQAQRDIEIAKEMVDLASSGYASGSLTSTTASLGSGYATGYFYGPTPGPSFGGGTTTATLVPGSWTTNDPSERVPMKKFEELQAHVVEIVQIVESLMAEIDELKTQLVLARALKAA
jgi:hypothetical protein